jgi:hypothetical protein
MTKLLRSACLLLALLGITTPAAAQVNVVPSPGLTTDYLRKTTYFAPWIGLVTAATATDVICISGAASKTVRVQKWVLSGTGTTANTVPLTILRRVVLDSGGTAATTTANPANTIGKALASDPTPAATLISYTANPTINDTSPTYIASASLGMATAASAASIPLVFDFVADTTNLLREPTIISGNTTVQFCANFNSTSVAGSILTGYLVWTEE